MYNSTEKMEKATHQIHLRLTDTEFKNLMEVVETMRYKNYCYDTQYGMSNAIKDALFLLYEVEVNNKFELIMVQKDENEINQAEPKKPKRIIRNKMLIGTPNGTITMTKEEYEKYKAEKQLEQTTPAI